MAEFKLTEARARVLREIVNGTTAHKEMYGKRSFACDRNGRGCTSDVTRIVGPLETAKLVRLIPNHNGWRMAWAATDAGVQALADYDSKTEGAK